MRPGPPRRHGGRLACAALVLGLALLAAAPAVSLGADAVEGSTYPGRVVAAPAGCSAQPAPSVDWGDGQASSPASCASFNSVQTGAHTYRHAGSYAAVASYMSSNGPRTTAFAVSVTDAALTATGRDLSAVAGRAFGATVAHLVDANPYSAAGDYTAAVDWGDGATSAGTLAAAGDGFDVTASHTYGSAGRRAVTVTVADEGGATATATGTAIVAAAPATTVAPVEIAPPAAAPAPAPQAAFTIAAPQPDAGGASLTLDASATHSPGALAVAQYRWQVAGANTTADTCGPGTSKLKLFLAKAGAQTITLTVSDVAGRTTQVQQTAQVAGVGYRPAVHAPHAVISAPMAWCIPGVNDPPVDVSANGGPPHGCNQTFQVGITEAVGCFVEIDKGSDIPAAEAAILDQQPQWTASGAHAIDAATTRATGARAARFNPAGVALLSGPALAYFARPFVSHSEVRFNGVDYIPHGGASILIVPALGLIISSDATIALAKIPIANGQVAEYVPYTRPGGRVHVDDYQLSREARRVGVAGLDFDGRIGLDFLYHRAELTASITMPSFFSTAGGEPFNAAVVLHADNHSGLQLDQIHLGPLNADVFGLGFSDVRFDYDAPSDDWDAQGKLDLFGALAIDATPDPPNPPEYGVHFRGGTFKSAGAAADFGDSGIEIFPGIQLNRVGVAVSLDPTLFIGDIGLRVLELGQISGRVLVALPSDAAPYVLSTGDAGPQFAQLAGRTFTGSPTVGVGGALALQIAGIDIPFANAYVLYSYPSYLAFGGNVQYGADDFGIDGGVNGEFNVGAGQFNVEGHVQINLPDPLPGFGGDVVVSSKGIAACGSGYIFPEGHIELGAGYHWGDGLVLWIQNCNIGEFRQQVQTRAARAADQGARTFTLPAGLPDAEVRLSGAGGAPDVSVRGPDGQTASSPTGTLGGSGRFLLVRTPNLDATWISIKKPLAGTYTVSTAPGSPAITALATADGLPPAAVRANVTGSGTHRVLHYDVRPRPNQQVTFLEGSHRIASTTTGGQGSVAFTPAGASLGSRAVIAQVTLAGLPNADLAVAHFTVTRPPRLARVGGLRVGRDGRVLRITWRPTPGAAAYAVDVHGTDGTIHSTTTSARRTSALVRGIPRTVSGRVTITAVRDRDHGPHTSASFDALAPLRTGVHAIAHHHRKPRG
jgi:PKD repeat protein